jgi:hypothetical protein
MSKDKRVTRIMDRVKKSENAKANMKPIWKELDEFYRGEQYKNSNIPPWVPKPVTNFIHLVITMKRAALASENPSATLRPMSLADIEPVRVMQQIYEWVWKRIKARKTVRENIETSKLLGTGIGYVYWDEMTGVLGGTEAQYEGEIKTKEIDPMNFHIDPNAYRLEEAQWCHVTEKRPKKWVEQQFGISFSDSEHTTQEEYYGEDYERDYHKENDKEDAMVDFHAHYEKYWNKEKMTEQVPRTELDFDPETGEEVEIETGEFDEVETDEEIGGWNYKVTYVAAGKFLKTIDPLEPNMYPFAILYDFPQRQSFWGKGTAELILENQKLINKVESIIAMIGTLLQNPQKIVSRKSGINPIEAMKYSFAPGHTWYVNGSVHEAMTWQQVPQIPQALVNLAEMAKENIREITGMNEAYMGQSVGSLQTSGGVNSLIDRATMRDRDQMFDVEMYVEDLSRIILGFVTTKYTEERYIRLIEDPTKPDTTTSFQEFVGTDFAGIEYDMELDVSGKAPITQARREAELTELIQLQGQYNYTPAIVTPQEFVKGKNMVDADKIIQRMNREEMQNKLDMLTQVYQMTAEAAAAGVPMQDIMGMAEQQLRQLESGEIPLDANAEALGGGGIGSAANNSGQVQAQQASL